MGQANIIRNIGDDLEAEGTALIEANGGFGSATGIFTERQLRRARDRREVSIEDVFGDSELQVLRHSDMVRCLNPSRIVKAALDAMLTDDQSAFTFAYYQGCTQRDIAKQFRRSTKTVNKQLKLAFDKLRSVLPTDPYWNIVELLIDVFTARMLSYAGRI